MDLTEDFPNGKVYDAQAIIQRLDAMIKEIESKRATINRMHNDITNEGTKLDFIIKSLHEIQQSMIGDYQLKSVMVDLEKRLDGKLNGMERDIMNKFSTIEPPENEESSFPTVIISAFLGLSIGIMVGFFMRR